MFHPMAFTVVFALTGALILSLTFVPAAVALLVTGRVSENENLLMRGARALYEPALRLCDPCTCVRSTGAALLVAFACCSRPAWARSSCRALDEGDIALHALRIPGTGLVQAIAMQRRLEDVSASFQKSTR